MTIAKPTDLYRFCETTGDSGTEGDIVAPSSGKMDIGWAPGEPPPAEFLNWLANGAYKWFRWLDAITDPNGHSNEMVMAWYILNQLIVGGYVTITGALQVGDDARFLKALRADTGIVFAGYLHANSVSTDQDNFAPSGIVDDDGDCHISVLGMKCSVSINLTGIAAAQVEGQRLVLINENASGGGSISLTNDADSTAANRFLLTGGITIPPNGAVTLVYDGTNSRWRAVGSSL